MVCPRMRTGARALPGEEEGDRDMRKDHERAQPQNRTNAAAGSVVGDERRGGGGG